MPIVTNPGRECRLQTNYHPSALRMRSVQGLGGTGVSVGDTGVSTSSILKSPFGAQATPRDSYLLMHGPRLAKQRSRTDLVAVALPILLPPPKQSPFPSTLDVSVGLHLGLQIADPPDLTGRIDAADRVSVDRNSASRAATTTFEMGMTPIPPLNFTKISSCLRSWLLSATTDEAKNPPMRIDQNRYEQTLFHDCTSILIFYFSKKDGCIFIC